MTSEKEIVEGCKRGKRKYQDMLYDKFAALLLGVCVRYIKNRMEAEDVLHDSFIKIYINIKKFNYSGEGSLFFWAKRITVNTALNYLRDNKKVNLCIDNIENVGEIIDEIEESDFNDISQSEILAAMDDMPHGYKLVFNMYVIEKFSHYEIAESLGVSVNTSKTQLFKARNYLKQKFKKNLIESKFAI